MRKPISLVLLSTILLAIVIWWIGFNGDKQSTVLSDKSGASSAEHSTDAVPIAEPSAIDGVPSEPVTASTAKRIVHVPSGKAQLSNTKNNYGDTTDLTDTNSEAFYRLNLEAALLGDLNAADRALSTQKSCKYMHKNESEAEQYLAHYLDYMKKSREDNPTLDFPSNAEYRTSYMSTFIQCRKQEDFFNEKLRNELDSLAQQGNVVARYIYAMWQPNYLGSADAFLKMQEWSLKANEYSFLNLEQGEVAGLLAFGNSYKSGYLFTERNRLLADAFYMAAINCGHTDSSRQRQVDKFLSSENKLESDLRQLSDVLAISEKLTMYCR